MNIMNMPGFVAEAAIYRSRGHYRVAQVVPTRDTQHTGELSMALINLDGVDCGNCVGGECVLLHCFEDWVQGGGGAGGPYQGGGGGGGLGGDGGNGGGGVRNGGSITPVTCCCVRGCVSGSCPGNMKPGCHCTRGNPSIRCWDF